MLLRCGIAHKPEGGSSYYGEETTLIDNTALNTDVQQTEPNSVDAGDEIVNSGSQATSEVSTEVSALVAHGSTVNLNPAGVCVTCNRHFTACLHVSAHARSVLGGMSGRYAFLHAHALLAFHLPATPIHLRIGASRT